MLDNLEDPGVALKKVKGQWIRDEDSLLRIFRDAGLLVKKRSELTWLEGNYYPVVLWALY